MYREEIMYMHTLEVQFLLWQRKQELPGKTAVGKYAQYSWLHGILNMFEVFSYVKLSGKFAQTFGFSKF